MKKAIAILVVMCALSCTKYNIDEILLSREDISLTVNGIEQFVYEPASCQMSHNRSTHEYRVYEDDLSEWFTVRCAERPANTGQEFSADISWKKGIRTRNEKGLTLRIEKIDASGTIWLWSMDKNLGIVIKNL